MQATGPSLTELEILGNFVEALVLEVVTPEGGGAVHRGFPSAGPLPRPWLPGILAAYQE